MYVYIRSEPGLWTVGFYDPNGEWQPDSDHGARDEAAARVRWLNGGNEPGKVTAIVPDRVQVKAREEQMAEQNRIAAEPAKARELPELWTENQYYRRNGLPHDLDLSDVVRVQYYDGREGRGHASAFNWNERSHAEDNIVRYRIEQKAAPHD